MKSSLEPDKMISMINRALLGRPEAVTLAVCTFLADGHLLIEDVPGVGKTTLARSMAAAFGGEFRRIQFTADMLPADVTGVSIWDPGAGRFEYREGPIFANIVLSDEINRAPPRTQSALLEAMSEKQISVDGKSRPLPSPFMVIATQNALEHFGTYPLPESQMDRFTMRISIGYPQGDVERRFIGRKGAYNPVDTVEPVFSATEIAQLRETVDDVRMDDAVLDYLMQIVERTRTSEAIRIGVSPRGAMALHRSARAMALLQHRMYTLVDDIKQLAVPVLGHRIEPVGGVSQGTGSQAGPQLIRGILASLDVPV